MLNDINTSPNADVRKCKAKAVIHFNDGATADIVLENEIISAKYIGEYQILSSHKDSNQPACEISVTFDNTSVGFDLTDPNNMYYNLTKKSVIVIYLSTTEAQAETSYIKKGTVFYSEMKFLDKKAIVTGYDPFGFSYFGEEYMYEACNDTDGTTRGITNYALQKCTPFGDTCSCVVSDALNGYTFAFSVFTWRTWSPGGYSDNYMTQQIALPYISILLSNRSSNKVRILSNEDGNIEFRQVPGEVTEEITKADYIGRQIGSLELSDNTVLPTLTFTDRGNILRQLTDVVNFHDDSKTYKLEIFRISYMYDKGILSAENTGCIIAA